MWQEKRDFTYYVNGIMFQISPLILQHQQQFQRVQRDR